MFGRIPSSESSEVHFTEIKVDPKEGRALLDRVITAQQVLTARILPKHPRSQARRRPVLEINLSAQTNWRNVGQALRAHVLERAFDPCDCYYCRSQRTKCGRRERCWV